MQPRNNNEDLINMLNGLEIRKDATRKEIAAKKAEMEKELQSMRITAEEEKELANPNSEKEWVKKHQARERRLIESGVTKETLDSLVAYYKSKLDSGNMVAMTTEGEIWQPPQQPPHATN